MEEIIFRSVVNKHGKNVIVEDTHPMYKDKGKDIVGVEKLSDSEVIAQFLSRVKRKDLLNISREWLCKKNNFAIPQDEITASKMSKVFKIFIFPSDTLKIH